jgi:hypothetical protein
LNLELQKEPMNVPEKKGVKEHHGISRPASHRLTTFWPSQPLLCKGHFSPSSSRQA